MFEKNCLIAFHLQPRVPPPPQPVTRAEHMGCRAKGMEDPGEMGPGGWSNVWGACAASRFGEMSLDCDH